MENFLSGLPILLFLDYTKGPIKPIRFQIILFTRLQRRVEQLESSKMKALKREITELPGLKCLRSIRSIPDGDFYQAIKRTLPSE